MYKLSIRKQTRKAEAVYDTYYVRYGEVVIAILAKKSEASKEWTLNPRHKTTDKYSGYRFNSVEAFKDFFKDLKKRGKL